MARGWARIDLRGSHNLRRGTWYPVTDDSDPLVVTLDVNSVPTDVERTCVRISPTRRVAWSVVVDEPPNPYFGRLYGVCPSCVNRARLGGYEASLVCPSCGYLFPVDWSSVLSQRLEFAATEVALR